MCSGECGCAGCIRGQVGRTGGGHSLERVQRVWLRCRARPGREKPLSARPRQARSTRRPCDGLRRRRATCRRPVSTNDVAPCVEAGLRRICRSNPRFGQVRRTPDSGTAKPARFRPDAGRFRARKNVGSKNESSGVDRARSVASTISVRMIENPVEEGKLAGPVPVGPMRQSRNPAGLVLVGARADLKAEEPCRGKAALHVPHGWNDEASCLVQLLKWRGALAAMAGDGRWACVNCLEEMVGAGYCAPRGREKFWHRWRNLRARARERTRTPQGLSNVTYCGLKIQPTLRHRGSRRCLRWRIRPCCNAVLTKTLL